MPKISVVMSVYNGEKYLREAIDSILNQTFKDFEFIIIDDGSTDSSAEVIKSYNDPRIKLIQQKNRGLSAALNRGIREAKGKYIARMDADDISHADRLRQQVEFLENHPECVVVGSNAKVIDMNGEYLYTSPNPITWKDIQAVLPRTPFFHSSTMLRAESVKKCGGYCEGIKHHFEDYILWNKIIKFGELRNIKRPLILYRLVPSAITNRSVKDSEVMANIGINIIKNDTISENDLEILENITRKKSNAWRESNYYLYIGKIFLEYNFNRKKAIQNLLISIAKYPFIGTAWCNLFLSFLPLSWVRAWKKYRTGRRIP